MTFASQVVNKKDAPWFQPDLFSASDFDFSTPAQAINLPVWIGTGCNDNEPQALPHSHAHVRLGDEGHDNGYCDNTTLLHALPPYVAHARRYDGLAIDRELHVIANVNAAQFYE
jgi:hypothetical protein